ncbi:MAG TPA: glycerol-3-phosphate dehydrogenase/oxidase [Verrucomicrobiae bacterium]|nr:glycerol-3-phosphate dehydrogenase/oxidase [Verrucomicrobiae bacterium]
MRQRAETIQRIAGATFDVCVIGGGATGAGCALDAQLRGLNTVLVEAGDFASGASTASTKLIHGGVRYLQEAVNHLDVQQYKLVRHALRERAIMLRNAPHLTQTIEFVVPCLTKLEQLYYGLGLKAYHWISGSSSLRASRLLTRDEAQSRIPAILPAGLAGAVAYADGQFDDARFALALVESFVRAGGEALNYARAVEFAKDVHGRLAGVLLSDPGSSEELAIRARAFVNATGPFSDAVRNLASADAAPRMRPSKGVHVLFPLDGFSEDNALLVPKTQDGRVIFAIPWNGRLLVGTTDTGYAPGDELAVTREEIDYLMRQLNPYLKASLDAVEAVSGFAGVRPLVAGHGEGDTKELIRDDEVELDPGSGLISILGGKWTTYRLMAERAIDKVQEYLQKPGESRSAAYPLAGSAGYHWDYWKAIGLPPATAQHLAHKYGTLTPDVLEPAASDASLGWPVVEGHPAIRAQVVYAARSEMAMTIEDVLARRIGLQLFSWRLAIEAAPVVASLLRRELDWTAAEESTAVDEYVGKIEHLIHVASHSTADP